MSKLFKEGSSFFEGVQRQDQIEKLTKQTVDLPEIYTVLYDLFKKQGVLASEDTNKYNNSPDKVVFNFSHPDVDLSTNNNVTVSYDLVERKTLEYVTTAGTIKQARPRQVAEYYDLETGGMKASLTYSYTNRIELVVISSTIEKLYQVLSYLETTFTRDMGYLLTYFTKVVYEGIVSNGLVGNNNPYGRPIHSKTICLRLDTEVPFQVVHEQIQQINL